MKFNNIEINKFITRKAKSKITACMLVLVGLFIPSMSEANINTLDIQKQRAVGGRGGSTFDDREIIEEVLYRNGEIDAINIWSGDILDAIQICYRCHDRQIWTPKHGGNGGSFKQFSLHQGETLAQVTLYTNLYVGMDLVTGISLHTNQGRTESYGSCNGMEYCFYRNYDGGTGVIGFHGRSGQFIDSLGVWTLKI